MKWQARVYLRSDYAGYVDGKTLHSYLWELRVAGALWEWRRL
jgi:hypothetical protein